MHSVPRNHQVLGVNRGVESVSRQEELKLELHPDQRHKRRLMESSIESRALAQELPDGDQATLRRSGPKPTASLVFLSQVQQQAFATPDSYDSDALRFEAVDDTKWRMDQLSHELPIKFGYDPAHFWVVLQCFDAVDNLLDKSISDVRYPLLMACRSANADSAKLMLASSIQSFEAEPLLGGC